MAPLSDVIHLSEPQLPETSVRAPRRTYIIYYVPGNPGLIEYYRIFMTHLYGLLRSQHPECDFEIYGRSLPGFEVGQSQTAMPRRDGQPGEDETGPPYNVNQEIEFTKSEIKQVVGSVRAKGKRDVRVILIGHSLGTYITMETIRRLREEAKESPASEERVRVVGGVLLFATVMDLAKSPSGLGKGRFLCNPTVAWLLSTLTKALVMLPDSLLAAFIGLHGDPPEAARVTAAFAKRARLVEQSLFLVRDEMNEISIDKWDDDIWGAAHPSSHPHPRPTLRFLFAKSDHWVADETRDELIRARGANGGEDWKPKMEVDEVEGWPHAFCIHHSIPVAERAGVYIKDIVERDLSLS